MPPPPPPKGSLKIIDLLEKIFNLFLFSLFYYGDLLGVFVCLIKGQEKYGEFNSHVIRDFFNFYQFVYDIFYLINLVFLNLLPHFLFFSGFGYHLKAES